MIITEKSELILFFNFFMLERGSSKLASSKQRCYQPSDFCWRQHYWLPIYVFNGSIKLITGLLKRRRFVVAKIKAARFPHSLILRWIYSSMQNWSYTGKLRFQNLVQQVIAQFEAVREPTVGGYCVNVNDLEWVKKTGERNIKENILKPHVCPSLLNIKYIGKHCFWIVQSSGISPMQHSSLQWYMPILNLTYSS